VLLAFGFGESIAIGVVSGVAGGLVPAVVGFLVQHQQNKAALEQYERQQTDRDRREAEQRRRDEHQRAAEVLSPIRLLLRENQPDETVMVEERYTSELAKQKWDRWRPLRDELVEFAASVPSQQSAQKLLDLHTAVHLSLSSVDFLLIHVDDRRAFERNLEEARRRHTEATDLVEELIEDFRVGD